MGIVNAKWADAEGSCVLATVDGVNVSIPADPSNRHYHDIITAGVAVAPYQPSPLTVGDFASAVQGHIDATASAMGYADGVALAGYSSSTIPAWAAEAQAFIAWRDQVWIYAYTELAKVQGGQRAVPTIEGLIAELPVIKWPGG